MADSLSNQIYLSRDSIREQISNQVKSYLELENVDLTKSSFLSFLIDTLSTLTSNLLFYQLSTYREFFLTKAQLPESILNLSSFLGYNTREATPAQVNVMMTIPFGFDDPSVTINIPSGFVFTANNEVDFKTTYETNISVIGNSTVTVQVVDGNKRYNLPVETTFEDFNFLLPLTQTTEIVQEFQIDSDIQQFQFVTLDVIFSGEVSSIDVKIKTPGSASYDTWTEFNSLFLMSATDRGFVSRRTDTGRRLSFGNGLIGVQPEAGSTVLVTVQTTQGEDGNVIAGSIRDGKRIYITTLAGQNQIVDYSVINPSAAYGGVNEESIEDIRKNAIASISSLNRLVTENDYKNINVIVPDSPIAQNSLPVLKRSDLQVNEISLFSAVLFGSGEEETDRLVPIKNAAITVPSSTSIIPRDELVQIDGFYYYNIFEIIVDLLNTVGNYEYLVYQLEQIPALETSYTTSYDIYSSKVEVLRNGTQGTFKLYYTSTETNSELTSCEMTIRSSGTTYPMVNDSTNGYYIFTFDPYTDIPADEQTYEFVIYDPSNNPVAKYTNILTFRKDLSNFMRSNIVEDGTSIIVYDVPVIEKEYYDSINKRDFELQVMQILISSLDLTDHKMLTDFSNIKFTTTHGHIENMLLNQPTISSVIDIVQTLPGAPLVGGRYILSPPSGNNDYQDNIIRCTDSTGPTFTYQKPTIDTIAYVDSYGENYIYSERGWIPLPVYNIPLEIEIEVFRESTYSGTLTAFIDLVRETIYEAFKDRFGTNATIYRSEIIRTVQEIEGVNYCRLRKPETSIFFNYKLKDFTEEQLLRYGPEYVYFKKENITVRVA